MNVLLFLGAALLYGAWGTLVLLGKADAHEYVGGLTAGLTWLATHVTNKSAARGSIAGAVVAGLTEPTADAPAAAAPAAAPEPTSSPASTRPVILQPQASGIPLQ